MLKLGEPTELPSQEQSLARRVLMFPLTRLFVAGIVFALVAALVAGVAGLAVGFVDGRLLTSSGLSISSVTGLSDEALEVVVMVLVYGLLAVTGIVTAVFMGKVVERRSLAEVGLGRRGLLRHILQGFGIGTGMILLLLLLEKAAVLLGLIGPAGEEVLTLDYLNLALQQLQEFGVFGYLGLAFAFACFVAVAEEIVFRGFLFRILEEGVGSWLALALSAVLFGAIHLANFEDPTLWSVASQTAGGVALAAAYMLTRKLWLPIGIHLGWDFAIFVISPEAMLTLSDASAEALPALTALVISMPDIILAIVLLVLVIRRGQIRTPRWMQRKRRTDNMTSGDINVAPLTEEKAAYERIAL